MILRIKDPKGRVQSHGIKISKLKKKHKNPTFVQMISIPLYVNMSVIVFPFQYHLYAIIKALNSFPVPVSPLYDGNVGKTIKQKCFMAF